MAANMGWIKLHRSIREHWIFQDPVLLRIWLDILLTVNHEPAKVRVKNIIVEIGRGQHWTSIKKLAVRWGLDTKTVRTKLHLLENDGMIYVDSRTGYGTLLTVRNYEVYQGFSEDDSLRDSPRNSLRNSPRAGFETPSEIPYEQECINNDEEGNKNGKNNGLAPGDPYYFEEV